MFDAFPEFLYLSYQKVHAEQVYWDTVVCRLPLNGVYWHQRHKPKELAMGLSVVSLMLFLNLANSLILVMGAQTNQTDVPLGSSIDAGGAARWLSPSGRFAFGFYPNGEGFSIGVWLITTDASMITIVWTANRDDPPVSGGSVVLTSGGSLQWKSPNGGQGKAISQTSTAAASAAMLDTGDFVLYDTGRRVIWSTFGSPTDTLLAGQSLLPGNQLFSSVSETDHSTGKYRLINQEDGNIVMYPVGSADPDSSYWSTATYGMGLKLTLWLGTNGTLWLDDANTSYTKTLFQANRSSALPSADIYYLLRIDADGILRLYSHAFFPQGRAPATEVEWEVLDDRCLVKGVCGPNSFCQLTGVGREPNCSCLPGFDFLRANESTLGCWRTTPVGYCSGKSSDGEATTTSTMVQVKSTTSWGGNSYSIQPSTTSIDDCRALCLADCACEMAMFSDSMCSKRMLPMRFGRMAPSNTTLFVKVYHYQRIAAPEKKKMRSALVMLISSAAFAATAVIVLLASALLFCKHRRSAGRYMKAPHWHDPRFDEENAGIRPYSFHDLEVATDGFAEELGRGAFGAVFKGVFPEGAKDIAVKRLEKVIDDGEREFQREVRAIARTHHRNLVRLLGFCNEGTHRLLVYEYVPSGSLANLLFKSDARPSWSERVAIALDVARGLQYLHEDVENPIIHCDIKPENILIGSSGMAKIADFGLAKLLMGNQTRTFTGVRGTRGYLAPEWSRNTAITAKVDVYSYGVMLLEIISCERSMGLKLAGEEYNISEWVYERVLSGEVNKVASGEDVDEVELERMAKVGIWCTQNEPVTRPAMKSVVLMIQGNMEVRRPPPPASFSQSLVRVRSIS